MLHMQLTVHDWPQAVARMGVGTNKTIDQGQAFREAKAANSVAKTCLRHDIQNNQPFGGNYAENKQRARDFFDTFIDGTFMTDIAPWCDFVEEWNEYLAISHTEAEKLVRLTWARAAAQVWRDEYRTRPGLEHIRLVICNTAIGNDIDIRFAEIAVEYDAVMGYHPYTYWTMIDGEPIRAANDWVDLSGRWERMDQEWRASGIQVEFLFTEAGPFESVEVGWRHPKCLGGVRSRYVDAMREWIRDVRATHAYRTGRIHGFCLFTSGGGSRWQWFETMQPELNMLAEMIDQEWSPGAPQPPAPEPLCKGLPREQYARTVNVIPEYATEEQAVEVFLEGWRRSRETAGGSYDDAGIGDLENKVARLHGIPVDRRQVFREWYEENYPGTRVEFVQ